MQHGQQAAKLLQLLKVAGKKNKENQTIFSEGSLFFKELLRGMAITVTDTGTTAGRY